MTEEFIKIGVYWYYDEDTRERIFDTEEMTREFERKIEELK